MASEEHKLLAGFVKEVHSALRNSCINVGIENAWRTHCEDKERLVNYARCMEKLATTHWEENYTSNKSSATSRIKWTVDVCCEYFIEKTHLKYKQREIEIAEKLQITIQNLDETFSKKINLIDVGSCYNPFKIYNVFDVLAIDLCPANNSVLECDFLNVSIGSCTITDNEKVVQLQNNTFDVVTFCFLLEYLPSSELRIAACEKAYNILKPGGLLIICTPDSKHVGANCKIMKCWQYTLSILGFTRIKYEKFKHMHCMAYRKCHYRAVGARWAQIHKKPYMNFSMNIPQDFSNINKTYEITTKVEASIEDFNELPFSNSEENNISKQDSL